MLLSTVRAMWTTRGRALSRVRSQDPHEEGSQILWTVCAGGSARGWGITRPGLALIEKEANRRGVCHCLYL